MDGINLPEHWKIERLGQFCRVFSGYGVKTSNYTKTGIPLIKIGNLQDGDVIINPDNDYVPESWGQNENLQKFVLKEKDILIALTGQTGKTAVVSPSLAGAFLNQRVGKIELISSDVDQDFISVVTKTEIFQEAVRQNTFRSVQGNISPSSIAQILIPLPPLPEQRAIAHILQTIQEAKFTRQREIALERERKATLMDYLFSHGTKGEPRKQTEIGEIPESWDLAQLGKLTEIIKGGTPKRSENKYFQGDIRWAIPTDITSLRDTLYISDTNSHISEEGLNKSAAKLLPEGTVLLTSRATIGETAITTVPMATNQGFANFICKDGLLNVYLAYYLGNIKKRLIDLASGSTFKEITKGTLVNIHIPLPPLPEQQQIAKILQAIDEKIAALEKEVEHIDELFHAMLEELMTGQRSAVPLIDVELPS